MWINYSNYGNLFPKNIVIHIKHLVVSLFFATFAVIMNYTIEKIANALGVSMKSLFEPLDDVEGYIRIGDKIYQFNSRQELNSILEK